MELILWRHAEAEDGSPGQPDETRTLTSKGRKQAQKMAGWLARTLPEDCRILCSPAVRTQQTVEALGRKFKTEPALAPDTSPEDILKVVGWPDNPTPVLVVGHQPTLGHVASRLIAGEQQDWQLRKGSICWIAIKDDGEPAFLKAVIGADLADK